VSVSLNNFSFLIWFECFGIFQLKLKPPPHSPSLVNTFFSSMRSIKVFVLYYFVEWAPSRLRIISCELNDSHLHAKTDSKKWNIVLPCISAVNIFPSIPLDPKPGQTSIPLKPLNLSVTFFSVYLLNEIYSTSISHSLCTAMYKRFGYWFYASEVRQSYRLIDFWLNVLDFSVW